MKDLDINPVYQAATQGCAGMVPPGSIPPHSYADRSLGLAWLQTNPLSMPGRGRAACSSVCRGYASHRQQTLSPGSSGRPQCRGQEPETAGEIQGLDSKVNILSLSRMKREYPWWRGAGSLVQLSLQGSNITERFPGFGAFHLEIAGSFL